MAVTVEKLSVSLNVENATWLRERSEESEVSVSALVDEAVGAKRRHEALGKLLKELGEDEPLSDAMGSFLRAEMRGSDPDVVRIGDAWGRAGREHDAAAYEIVRHYAEERFAARSTPELVTKTLTALQPLARA
jgi:hypothetical protein